MLASAARRHRARGSPRVEAVIAAGQVFGPATMKPVRTIELTHAAAIDGSSHGRTPAVLLVLDERNALIRAAARFYPGDSDREIARRLHRALAIYRSSRWQRRDCIEATCPAQHRGK